MSKEKESLSAASQTILLELARFLLKNDITHREFTQLSRRAFVQAGNELLEGEDHRTMNRLIELTGLSRNEIARTEARLQTDMRKSEGTWTIAMRGLHRWHTRTEFVDQQGNPVVLDLTDSDVFNKLFETSDRKEQEQILSELLDAKSVTEISEKSWKPLSRYYLPKNRVLIFHYFGRAVSRLISTLDRNINNSSIEHWIERAVSTADLKPDARPLFSRVGREQALRFIESLDDWASSNEYELSVSDETDSDRIGLGVYYFEEKR